MKNKTEENKEQAEGIKEEVQEEVPEAQPQPRVFISTSTSKQKETRKARIQTHDLSPDQIARGS